MNPRAFQATAFALLCVIWGSTWLAIKFGVEAVPTFLSAALRFVVASAVLLALTLALGRQVPRGRRQWAVVVAVGIVLFGGDYGLIYWAEANGVESGLTAVLFATMPLLTAFVAQALLSQERLTAQKVLGIAVGFAGVVLIFRGQLGEAGMGKLFPMVAVILAAACGATGTVAIKRWAHDVDGFAFNGFAMALGSATLALASLASGETWSVPSWPNGLVPILYLALVGSVVAFATYLWLLRRIEATTGSFITLITPLVALYLGVAFASETVDAFDLIGTAMTLAGIGLFVSRRVGAWSARVGKPRQAEAHPEPPSADGK